MEIVSLFEQDVPLVKGLDELFSLLEALAIPSAVVISWGPGLLRR